MSFETDTSPASLTLTGSLPAGTALIGKVGIDQTTPGTTNLVTVGGFTGVDGSTTITAGGTAQALFTPVNGFEICNPDPSEDLWISDSTTAAANGTGSYRIVANGGIYTTPVGYKPIGQVSIYGATTGHKVTARRW